MNILGINYVFHDSTACVVQDGRLTVAIEEERLTRRKHTREFPVQALSRCLEVSGLTSAEIDHVAVSYQPGLEWPRKVAYGFRLIPRRSPLRGLETFTYNQAVRFVIRQAEFHRWFDATFTGARKPKVHYVPHHLGRAAGSFFVSPYESAALLSTDGSGEWATTFKGVGRGSTYECLGQDRFPVSHGEVYSAVTEFCGFKPNYDEGKTMGLAPFGNPETFEDTVAKIVWVDCRHVRLRVDRSYFDYPLCRGSYSRKFLETFGSPRKMATGAAFEQHHKDVAAAFQRNLEECLLAIARGLRERTKEDYLVISGGVALNSVANGRLVRESGFKDVYVMPAAGATGRPSVRPSWPTTVSSGTLAASSTMIPMWGRSIPTWLSRGCWTSASSSTRSSPRGRWRRLPLNSCVAVASSDGSRAAWRSAPALGNRSILADPTLPGMKDKINAEVKHREAFRPFAPSCPIDDTPRFFEQNVADPFMLKVCYVRPEMRAALPAITHVDGTARLQTVHADTNPRYYRLRKEFEKLSGFPVLLNTSFNVTGEPIVESPLDAIRCFTTTGLDYLVLGSHLLGKRP